MNKDSLRKLNEKKNRSLAATLGSPEKVILESGEEWNLYPLDPRGYNDILQWIDYTPCPDPDESMACLETGELCRPKPSDEKAQEDQEDEVREKPCRCETCRLYFKTVKKADRWGEQLSLRILWTCLRPNELTTDDVRECYLTGEWPLTMEEVWGIVPPEKAEEVAEQAFRFFRHRVEKQTGKTWKEIEAAGRGLGKNVLPGQSEAGAVGTGVSGDEPGAASHTDG